MGIGQLNAPDLKLPDTEEVTAFRCIDRIIRTDKVLQAVVGRNFYSWTGNNLDDADPTTATLPWVRLSCSGLPMDWATEGQHRSPLMVTVELAVMGTNSDNLVKLWGAVRKALFPREAEARDAVRAAQCAAMVQKITLRLGPTLPKKLGDGTKILYASGAIELLLHINT